MKCIHCIVIIILNILPLPVKESLTFYWMNKNLSRQPCFDFTNLFSSIYSDSFSTNYVSLSLVLNLEYDKGQGPFHFRLIYHINDLRIKLYNTQKNNWLIYNSLEEFFKLFNCFFNLINCFFLAPIWVAFREQCCIGGLVHIIMQ